MPKTFTGLRIIIESPLYFNVVRRSHKINQINTDMNYISRCRVNEISNGFYYTRNVIYVAIVKVLREIIITFNPEEFLALFHRDDRLPGERHRAGGERRRKSEASPRVRPSKMVVTGGSG